MFQVVLLGFSIVGRDALTALIRDGMSGSTVDVGSVDVGSVDAIFILVLVFLENFDTLS